MPGSSRQPSPRPPAGSGLDKDATVESLLVAGLDLYFAGQHERAIQTWTRVLFLDRNHARARAYIDRARRVVAESQREADELLHGSVAAFDEGDPARARALLDALVERGSADDLALALLERIERLESAQRSGEQVASIANPPVADTIPPVGLVAGRRANRFLIGAAGVVLLAAMALAASWDRFMPWWQAEPARGAEPSIAVEPDALPLPASSELVMSQARALMARGHLHEALRALDEVRLEDGRRAEADRLRAEIQAALLASISSSVPSGTAGSGPDAARP
jgi:hypothetical protein